MTVQTLYTAATGMEALETKLDVIANNMANVETPGFKRDVAMFQARFAEAIQQNQAPKLDVQHGLHLQRVIESAETEALLGVDRTATTVSGP